LTAPQLIVVGFYTTLLSYMGSGPVWPKYVTNPVCKDSWIWNLLYLNNFLPAEQMVEAFSKNIKLRNVGKFHISYNLTSINELDELLCEFKLHQNNDSENNCSEIVDALHQLLNQLKEYVPDEKVNVTDSLADPNFLLSTSKKFVTLQLWTVSIFKFTQFNFSPQL
ncbi:hypothetical protein AVEN_172549-1, partial [Araneus ventricosus]